MIAVLVAALLVAQAPSDTVFTVDGGRVTGTVLEDSPTAGITIQTPDGAVRRIERAQVARIEFADGSVSTPRAAPAAPAPAPAQPASPDLSVRPAAAASGTTDTVYLSPSGRVRGTVMEESATTGVKVRRLDGSIQNYAAEEVSRIEYADGTVSTMRSPPKPAPAPAPAPAPKAIAEAPLDTVYFLGGGRVRGTVIEEHPKTGVKVRLLDGTVQTYSRDELVRIEYADGTVSRRKTPPAVAPASPPPPAPSPAAAPAAPPPKDPLKEQPAPLYVSLGVGGTLLGGSAEKGVLLESLLEPGQAHFAAEAALRLTPSIAIGGYADAGAGDAASAVREICQNSGQDCVGVTGRYGLLIRHTWDPLTNRPKWLSVGTGWEFASVEVDQHNGGSSSDLFRYKGRELVRIGAGVDFRSNPVLALGLYGSVSWGEFDTLNVDPGFDPSFLNHPGPSLESKATHTTAQLGLRLTLFP